MSLLCIFGNIVLILIVTMILVFLLAYFSKIELFVKELIIDYEDELKRIKFRGIITGKMFEKFIIFKFEINNDRIKKLSKNKYTRKLIENLINKNSGYTNIDNIMTFGKQYIRECNYRTIEIKSLNINLDIQIINIEITSYIVVLISTILSIAFAKTLNDNNNYYYQIIACNDESFLIGIKLFIRGIFTLNLAHIISIIIKVLQERRNVNGRKQNRTKPPNRRFNEYSYE